MMRSSYVLGLIALFATLLAVPQARGDYLIYGDFLQPDGRSGAFSIVASDHPEVGLFFQKSTPTTKFGSTDLVVATYETVASPSNPQQNTGHINGAEYPLQVHLTDMASGESGMLTFLGTISGEIGSGGELFTPLSNSFADPTTKTLTLGGNRYEVTIGPFLSPVSSGGVIRGDIMARVEVNPPVASVPEPSTLLLGGAGVAGLALLRRRFRTTPVQIGV